jgi:two-component system sensor histidine kinase BaeS
MNRMWVRISLVISCLMIFIALLPFIAHRMNLDLDPHPRPAISGLSDKQASEVSLIVDSREYRIWVSIFRIVGVGIIVGLVAGVLLSRWLAAPLRQLERGAKAVSEGKLDYRVPAKGSQEMQSVALAFNRMAQELRNVETLRRTLLADVTHELRHPIHVLQGNLQAIIDGVYPLDMTEVAGLLDQTQHLISIVDDLHELTLAENKQLVLNKQKVDLADLVRKVTESIQPLAAGEKITLETQIPPQPLVWEVDVQRIRQVLQNLLNNALRYTPNEGRITVSVMQDNQGVEIRVQDNGIGIEPEHLPHVFDRFYTVDPSRSRKTSGTGLGLAIAQAIVEAHGGEITVYSPGKNMGSTFTIRL